MFDKPRSSIVASELTVDQGFHLAQLLVNTYFVRRDGAVAIKYKGKFYHGWTDHLVGLAAIHILGKRAGMKVQFKSSKGQILMIEDDVRIGAHGVDNDGLSCSFVVDVDTGDEHKYQVADPRGAACKIYELLYIAGLRPYLEKSGGGLGYHIWGFSEAPVDAVYLKRMLAAAIPTDIKLLPNDDHEYADVKTNAGVEVFPKQEGKGHTWGNLVWLPWWCGAKEGGNQFYSVTKIDDGYELKPYAPLAFQTFTNKKLFSLVDKNVKAKVINRSFNTGDQKLLPWLRFERVKHECVAIREAVESAKVSQPPRWTGWALLSVVSRFEGGVRRFCNSVVGWGDTDKDIREIENYVRKYPTPMTCATLQERGVCKFTNPEECMRGRWQKGGAYTEPSPIRFAYRGKNTGKRFRESIAAIYGGENV